MELHEIMLEEERLSPSLHDLKVSNYESRIKLFLSGAKSCLALQIFVLPPFPLYTASSDTVRRGSAWETGNVSAGSPHSE
jgi:hypothetical protein